MMTKEELMDFVKEVYATYNQQLLMIDEKATFRAWYNLLYDLSIEEVRAAFLALATHEKFMPRPGDIRRAAIDAQTGIPQQIDAYSAWGIFQTIIREVHSGTQTQIHKPEALIKTMQQLGDSAMTMHTNGDREVFVRIYEKIAGQIEEDKYAFRMPAPPRDETPATNGDE